VKVILLGKDSELVRRLATGLISQWPKLPDEIKFSILREACLATDETSARTSLEQDLKQLIQNHQTAG
jgi:hypothetical protein